MAKQMSVLEVARTITVPDERVLVAGDWHGSVSWVQRALPRVRGAGKTLLHVGDFSGDWDRFLPTVDRWAAKAGIERVLVTLGNHEPWGPLNDLMNAYPGSAIRVSKIVWALPRPFRFTLGPWGYRVLSLGGASSLDFQSRTHRVDWWPEETVTRSLMTSAIEGGPADVMLTHDAVYGSGVFPVDKVIVGNAQQWSDAARDYADISRRRVTQVWDAVRPELLIHGHMHVRGSGTLDDGRRVEALHMNGHDGNIAVLDTMTLRLTDVQARQSRWVR